MRIAIILFVLIAAGAGYMIFGGDKSPESASTGVGGRIKNAATSVLVREIENPECLKLLNNIKSKTSATVQKISPAGHEILLDHIATKSTISLDCSTPSKMSMTFISKDSSPTDEWFKMIGDSSDALVGKEPALIIAEAKKCLAVAEKDPTTSAQEEVSGIDVDCALPESDESGFLVAVMAADPSAAVAKPPVVKTPESKPKAKESAHPANSGKHHK